MNIPGPVKGADGDKRLVKILRDYARRAPGAGFGFTPGSRESHPKRTLALVCRVDTIEPARIAACVEAGADAVELGAVATPATLDKVEGLLKVPWGLALGSASYDAWREVLGQGGTSAAEWVTLTMDDDARFLSHKGIARVLVVDLDMRPEMVRGLSVSGADAIIAVGGDRASAGPLTVAESLRLRLLADLVKQPILVSAELLSPGNGSVRLVKESGAAGLLLQTSDPEAIRAVAATLSEEQEEST